MKTYQQKPLTAQQRVNGFLKKHNKVVWQKSETKQEKVRKSLGLPVYPCVKAISKVFMVQTKACEVRYPRVEVEGYRVGFDNDWQEKIRIENNNWFFYYSPSARERHGL